MNQVGLLSSSKCMNKKKDDELSWFVIVYTTKNDNEQFAWACRHLHEMNNTTKDDDKQLGWAHYCFLFVKTHKEDDECKLVIVFCRCTKTNLLCFFYKCT